LSEAPPQAAAPAFGSSTAPRRYLYFLFAAALIPLVFSLLSEKDEAEFQERVEKTLVTYAHDVERIAQSQEIQKLAAALPRNLPKQELEAYVLSAILGKLIEEVPGAKLHGAHLPGRTWIHWTYALLASAAFLCAILLLFEKGRAAIKTLLLIGLFTGTIGIVFLIVVQWVAEFTQGLWIHGRGIIALLFYVLKFIGFSYRSALDPNSNFFLSFVGFTCGVGFCEELAKALPMLSHYRRRDKLGWRGACVMGLASGIGFGVAEGIMYSSDFYNGYATGGIYVVRFISCVALHSVWSASVGIVIYNRKDYLKGRLGCIDWAKALLWVLGIPMVLHGLYDTMLKREMNAVALLTALVSFGFLVWLIEKARSEEKRTGQVLREGG